MSRFRMSGLPKRLKSGTEFCKELAVVTAMGSEFGSRPGHQIRRKPGWPGPGRHSWTQQSLMNSVRLQKEH